MEVQLVSFSDYGIQRHNISGRECTIGREPTCDLRPDHGKVSGRHARLFWRGGRLFVEDLNSAEGTFVNGERVFGSAELNDGDELLVGPVHYLAMIAEDRETIEARDDAWIASTLKARHGGTPSDSDVAVSPAMNLARRILDKLGADEVETGGVEDTGAQRRARRAKGLSITEQQGVALARILNRSLIDEVEIRRLAHQLDELIETGHNRIALNFGNVEHFSSQALSTVLNAMQRCKSAGGAMKFCSIQPSVAELFAMTNLQSQVEIFPDEAPALESPWPRSSEAEEETERTGAKSEAPSASAAKGASVEPSPKTEDDTIVELVVDVGKSKGKAIPIKGRRFQIGRDKSCQLRPNSDTVSRIHAILERRGGKVFVRDYGTKNGTILSGRVLRGEEAEARDGDTLGVGVMKFIIRSRSKSGPGPSADEDALAAWLLEQGPADDSSPTSWMIPATDSQGEAASKPPETESAESAKSAAGTSSARARSNQAQGATEPPAEATHGELPSAEELSTASLECEIVRGVLVARIRETRLEDETTVGPLRYELQCFFEKPLPRRVVLSLENVDYLSSRAVGVILAFFQHLDRESGSLRVACVSPKLVEVLDTMRLPNLVDLYPTVEEAVNDPWI